VYYKTCPSCGANLDPDERCSCEDETDVQEDTHIKGFEKSNNLSGYQYSWNLKTEKEKGAINA
jgi:hypothetical protein